jgi:hypothetical protein
MVTIADSYEIHKKGVYEMKDKKTNVWVPVAVIIGILLVAMIVLTVFMVVTGRSAGNTGSSSSKYHADSTQSDVKPQDSDDYIQDVSLDEFSIGGSSDDSSASDNAEAAEVAMEDPNGYILPDSDSRKLKKSDLAGMTAQQLSYAKNEIYARHGRVFLQNCRIISMKKTGMKKMMISRTRISPRKKLKIQNLLLLTRKTTI